MDTKKVLSPIGVYKLKGVGRLLSYDPPTD